MKYLLLAFLLSTPCLTNAADDSIHEAPVYLTHGHDIYQIYDNKAYKVEVIDNKWYTTNLWFPLDQYGYTEEHVQKVKERQARRASGFIR